MADYSVRLIDGVRLIGGPLNRGFTVFQFGVSQISMHAMRMLKTTAAICVLIVQDVTTVSVQMDSKCLKTTRLVNVQKVFRSRSTGQCAWVSNNTKTVAGKNEDNSQ